MIRSEQETSLFKRVPAMAFGGILSIITGTLILLLPLKNIWVSYLGILPIITGFALLTPLMLILVEKVASQVYKRMFGSLGKMSSRSILQNISRTYVAVAALALAVAATVGVGTMISSFRSTVVQWLEARLDADIFISAPSLISRRTDVVLSHDILEKVKSLEEVREVNFFRELVIYQEDKRYHIIASGLNRESYSGFRFKEGTPEKVWARYEKGQVLLSEPFAYRNGLSVGSVIALKTDRGKRDFQVAGIYYDYASDQGFINIKYDVFRKFWDTQGVSGVSAFIKEGYELEAVKDKIQQANAGGQQLLIRTYRFLLDTSIEIFDRTFLIANVLQILSIIVAFIGILSALMSLQLERKHELGILRANGLLPFQLFKMINLQTLLMGVTAGLLALPLGSVLAAILVYIINKRSFGWTMQFELIPAIMIEALLLAIVAAVLAGVYPGYKMSRSSPALALREE
jgi:putative ABC transport system permease protein